MHDIDKIKRTAQNLRRNILDMTAHAGVGGGHLGGSLSCADALAVMFNEFVNLSPDNVKDENRDRFILSKGHVALAYYAVLKEKGLITTEEMMTFNDSGSAFATHFVKNGEKGIETSNGSLGYGLSIGIGCALAAKMKGLNYRTYVLLGDGECGEGSIYEAALSAKKFKLDKLVAIIDKNNQQNDGYTDDVLPIDCEAEFKAFGWDVTSVDGHDVEKLCRAFDEILSKVDGKPKMLVINTVKGKGIKSIEGKVDNHHVRIDKDTYEKYLEELESLNV